MARNFIICLLELNEPEFCMFTAILLTTLFVKLEQILYVSIYPPVQAGQPELIELEKALKAAMVPAGTAREVIYLFM